MTDSLVLRARRLLADFVAAGWSGAQTLCITTGGQLGLRANLGGFDRSCGSIDGRNDHLLYGNPRARKDETEVLRRRLLVLIGDVRDGGLDLLEAGAGHHFVLSPRRLSLAARPDAAKRTISTDPTVREILDARPLGPREATLLVSPSLSQHARLEAVAHAEAWLGARGRRLGDVVPTHLVSDAQALIQHNGFAARGPLDDSHRWWATCLR